MNDVVAFLPLSPGAPCGPSLEDDADCAVPRARMVPRSVVQYGAFIAPPESPRWAEIERDCRRLLERSRDIHLLVWLCRARTRLARADGLARSLELLAGVLETWPVDVHPQAVIDGRHDPAVRANALAALADPEGLLADVRDIVGTVPGARRQAAPGEDAASLAQASRALRRITAWADAQLGPDAPPLDAIAGLLGRFEMIEPEPASPMALRPSAAPTPMAASRADGVRQMRAARDWFEYHEPSSPVAVLLKQSERMVGLRFSQLADAVPLELLRQWDATPENDAP